MAKRQYPNLIGVEDVIKWSKEVTAGIPDGKGGTRWVPARSHGYASFFHRVRCAWLVFTGRADALTWPGQ